MLINNSKIVVVGTIRDVAKSIEKNLQIINKSLSDFKSINYFLVESDSSDATLEEIKKLKLKYNIDVATLGKLVTIYPDRIERIRYCRNVYVKHLREFAQKNEFQYVLVLDLDGIAKKVSKKGIRSCFNKEIYWDACFSNQLPFYHDIYALRAEGWNNSDPFKEIEESKKQIQGLRGIQLVCWIKENLIRQKILYAKMQLIYPWQKWIEVKSAFGGLAIYKAEIFLDFDYEYDSDSEYNTCEHVTLNEKLFKRGKKLYINPHLVTSYFNPYSLNKFILIRFLRYLKR